MEIQGIILSIIMVILITISYINKEKINYNNKELEDYDSLLHYVKSIKKNTVFDAVDDRVRKISKIYERYNEVGFLIVDIEFYDGETIKFRPNRFITTDRAV